MKKFLLCFFVLAIFGITACKKNQAPKKDVTAKGVQKRQQAVKTGKVDTSLPGDPVAGEKVYKRICLACHGAKGDGNGGVTAANFTKEPERLMKDNKVLLNSIANGIKKGNRVMPAQKGVLSEKEMKDALSYIRKNFGKKK